MTLEAMQAQTTCEHPTPQGILQAARDTFFHGWIFLDPASSAEMNQHVKAEVFYTKEDDGFSKWWEGSSCFLNPPGSQSPKGEPKGRSPLEWLDKLVGHLEVGDIAEAIYIGYNGPETLSKRPQHCRRAAGIIHSSTEHTGSSDVDGLTNNGRIKFLGDRPFFPSVILYYGFGADRFFTNFTKFGTRIIVP
jgi:hypothetical protein